MSLTISTIFTPPMHLSSTSASDLSLTASWTVRMVRAAAMTRMMMEPMAPNLRVRREAKAAVHRMLVPVLVLVPQVPSAQTASPRTANSSEC